ncbi:hypothetical protein M747DRAFT_24885 [Aspergillus niger ATCC 13496]|uniref:Uncharacterized protein n=1 Tax=Aspergillus niger ATCC 13496 TaxID=1353008 RepID=A0A370BZY1_ASPNG|nr:hypothetical protein M747DRAFT_24885 [Aspergillus niger ATCC 13496]
MCVPVSVCVCAPFTATIGSFHLTRGPSFILFSFYSIVLPSLGSPTQQSPLTCALPLWMVLRRGDDPITKLPLHLIMSIGRIVGSERFPTLVV